MYTENVQRRECRGWCIACDSRLDKYNIIRIRDDGVIDNSGGPRAAMGWSIKTHSIGLCIAKIFHPSRIWISPAGRPADRPTTSLLLMDRWGYVRVVTNGESALAMHYVAVAFLGGHRACAVEHTRCCVVQREMTLSSGIWEVARRIGDLLWSPEYDNVGV